MAGITITGIGDITAGIMITDIGGIGDIIIGRGGTTSLIGAQHQHNRGGNAKMNNKEKIQATELEPYSSGNYDSQYEVESTQFFNPFFPIGVYPFSPFGFNPYGPRPPFWGPRPPFWGPRPPFWGGPFWPGFHGPRPRPPFTWW